MYLTKQARAYKTHSWLQWNFTFNDVNAHEMERHAQTENEAVRWYDFNI